METMTSTEYIMLLIGSGAKKETVRAAIQRLEDTGSTFLPQEDPGFSESL